MAAGLGDQYDAQIIELYTAGFSSTFIGQAVSVSPTFVRRRLKENGVEIRPCKGSTLTCSRVPHREYERTAFLYKQCEMSLSQVARHLGISKATVYRRLEAAGVSRREKGEGTRLSYRQGRPLTGAVVRTQTEGENDGNYCVALE